MTQETQSLVLEAAQSENRTKNITICTVLFGFSPNEISNTRNKTEDVFIRKTLCKQEVVNRKLDERNQTG